MALAVLLPVAGLIVALAGITLLRAADRAQSALAVRRSVRGPRAIDPLVVIATAPWTVARALLTELLMAPLAFAAGVAVYAAAILLTHHHLTLPRAGAYAAGAMVAWYAIGPGSGRPRRQLNRMAAAVSRGTLFSVVIAVAAWGLAVAIALLAASQAPDYWPLATPHLPALHGLFSSATHWLLKTRSRLTGRQSRPRPKPNPAPTPSPTPGASAGPARARRPRWPAWSAGWGPRESGTSGRAAAGAA